VRKLQGEAAARTVSKVNKARRCTHYFSGSYCPQSSRYETTTKASRLLDVDPVLEAARKAKANGSTRFCMGAAWRDLEGRKRGFERILEMVREIRKMDMEVCTTLGMLSPSQAKQLKEAYVFYQFQIAVRPEC
jgi:biotin synthase-like enzyme